MPPSRTRRKRASGPRAERQVGGAIRAHIETWKNTIDLVGISTQRSDYESIPAPMVMICDRSVHFVYLSFVCSLMRSARRLPTSHHSPSRRPCFPFTVSRLFARPELFTPWELNVPLRPPRNGLYLCNHSRRHGRCSTICGFVAPRQRIDL